MEQEAAKQERFSNTLAEFAERLIKYNGALISFQIVLLFAATSQATNIDLTLFVTTVIAGIILSVGSIFSLILFTGIRATKTIESFFKLGLWQFVLSAMIVLTTIYLIGLGLTSSSNWVSGVYISLIVAIMALNVIIMWNHKKAKQDDEKEK